MSNEKLPDESQQPDYIKDWREVKRQAQEKCDLGSRLSKQASWEMDVADVHLRAAEEFPEITGVTGLSDYPRRLRFEQRRQLDNLQQNVDYSGTAVISSASVSGTYSALSADQLDDELFAFDPHSKVKVEAIRVEFETLITRHDRKGEVVRLMKRIDFENYKRGRDAIFQFEAAWEEHEKTSSTPTAPLLTMRAAVQFTVDMLLDRRVDQSGRANQKVKVTKIGKQLAAPSMTNDDFERLQSEYNDLQDGLSEHKAPKGTRQSEHDLLVRSTLFLDQLLNAVDPSKMRA